MEPVFPTFDRFSTPLLLLLAQGFIFVLLIGFRYIQRRSISDVFLAIFLFLFCYERVHYTVGFMSWYDSFPNTKINYFLFPVSLAFGPLIYFYVKSVTTAKFRWKNSYYLHFLPFIFYVFYRILLYFYDLSQSGFQETQNGYLMSHLEIAIINPLFILFSSFHILLYLAFTIQMYWFYRLKIKQFYSNTYKFELNWIRNFLVIFGLLFFYDVFQNIVDSFILEMHWTQKWWFHALSSSVIIYFGIKGYFTKTEKLQELEFALLPSMEVQTRNISDKDYEEEKEIVVSAMEESKPYLNSSLTLSDLAKLIGYSNTHLSEIINEGFQVNFNDFVNRYRVNEVKLALDNNRHEQMSLVGIAYDCGFNSKATFNRVFKKLEGISPSDYIKNQRK